MFHTFIQQTPKNLIKGDPSWKVTENSSVRGIEICHRKATFTTDPKAEDWLPLCNFNTQAETDDCKIMTINCKNM
jgi:hypothetical protein